ncbi:MAG: phosphoribosyl-ATP diphosphatase [Xanthobacteraceae bacterium]|nr:phosphoribosyl-ATP diphosphatase [Xanthobacteraceae bacterium]
MVARLTASKSAKHSAHERQHAAPAAAIHEALDELWAADESAVRIAPSDLGAGPEPVGNELDRLYAALAAVTAEDHPRTAKLLSSSSRKVAQKVIEEAGEVALAAVKHNNRNIVRESADLLYHLAVLWHRAGIGSEDVWAEMRRRADRLGIAEKLPKSGS